MSKFIFKAVGAVGVSVFLLVGCDNNPGGSGGGGGAGGATTGSFTDSRDSTSYKTARIGNQTWMAENLNYNASGSVCSGNADSNCVKYGRLYNWSTAMSDASSSSAVPSGVRGVCPAGWHLPSDAEWTQLTDAVGGSSTAGKKLKSTSGWYNNGNGTNEYGFSALPGGNGSSDGSFGSAGNYGGWWCATENDASYAWPRHMDYSYERVDRNDVSKAFLLSVRCVQD